jgi:hypothetical protein
MQGLSNRSVIVISGLLTLIVLGGATVAVGFRNGWLQVAAEAPSAGAVSARAQSPEAGRSPVGQIARGESSVSSSSGAPQDDVVVYRQKLEEAYRALDNAYAQIRSLQTAQTQLASRGNADRFAEHDGDDDRQRGVRRRESHDD